MPERVWETGFEQIGEREIDTDVRPWHVTDTYRVWLRYNGRTYHERVLVERDWAGPEHGPVPGESPPAMDAEELYGYIKSAIDNPKDRATTFGVPGEPAPPFDGEDPPPYKPSPGAGEGQYHTEGECWCGETRVRTCARAVVSS